MNAQQEHVMRYGVVVVVIIFLTALMTSTVSAQVLPSRHWKTTIALPDDSFLVTPTVSSEPRWVKFTILVDDPETVYWQDSNELPFHYDFATQLIEAHLGILPTEFEEIALYEDGQELILGALLIPNADGGAQLPEFGIQLVRKDAYAPQEVVDLFHIVLASVNAPGNYQPYYFPTFEQIATAQQNLDFLAKNGVIVGSPAMWIDNNSCYAPGWALGRLNFVPGDEIEQQYLAGTLKSTDILLTDNVPAEVPHVAGIITLLPSTPNSHVAILANTFGIPFAFLANEQDANDAVILEGNLVMLLTFPSALVGCDVRVINVQNELDQKTIDEILALKVPAPLNIAPIELLNEYGVAVDGLGLSDIKHVGGKASHFSLIREAVPNNSHQPAAITFDLWDEYLSQVLANGNTLREQIDLMLAPFAAAGWPPTDIAALSATLDDVRSLFTSTSTTQFTPQQEAAIIALLEDPQYGLLPDWSIRFRSSTNVEDSEQFSGAGLYSSHSGCLLDDLDRDFQGPSHCDPDEPNARGVFRAIRRVFRSFYNLNAYLSRLKYNVDEHEVGMAMLVHHSFPDEYEAANGVLVFRRKETGFSTIQIVTQLGAESVTSPTGNAIPEEVRFNSVVGDNPGVPMLIASSSLVPLGDYVMKWTADYEGLAGHVLAVADAYEQATGKTEYVLDYEFKKTGAGYLHLEEDRIWITQVRPLPQPEQVAVDTPFLINDPTQYQVFGGENTNEFALHRIKIRPTFKTRSMWLTPENIAEGIVTEVSMEYYDGCNIVQYEGPIDGLPNAAVSTGSQFGTPYVEHSWRFDDLPNPRQYRLRIPYDLQPIGPLDSPFLTIGDLGIPFGLTFPGSQHSVLFLRLIVEYDDPVPTIGGDTLTDVIFIQPTVIPSEDDLPQLRVVEYEGITVTADFHWQPSTFGPTTGTHALAYINDVTIEGLTIEPITLTDYFAASYRPGHHAFFEGFILEPRQDSKVPASILDELDTLDVRFLHVHVDNIGGPFGGNSSFIALYGDEVTGPCPDEPTIPGDLNGDGVVDGADLGILLSSWGPCEHCAADLNGDGVVDGADLGVLLSAWTS